ncbi:MAG: carboxypeptidase M32 [Amaricoccus sp.]|uniref:carboxypeptidase M32 n=1 Tax=Amaricoccus sp. TaxID=1872485 RepID=UPI0039E67125
MDAIAAYDEISARLRRIGALEQVAGFLNWDQETQMPPKGGAQRAEQAAAVASAIHDLAADPRLGELVAFAATAQGPDAVNVAEAGRLHRRAAKVPPALAADLARTASLGQEVWIAARAASDFAAFAPTLERIVALKRAEAECLAEPGVGGYDALLDGFEPGTTAAELDTIFSRLRPGLVELAGRIAAKGAPVPTVAGRFPAAAQMALAKKLGGDFGFDWQAGRLDLAVHPSCSGSAGDVRITTRVDEADPQDCLYSTFHEVGHAVYEQGLDPAQALLPAGMHASMAVHESQSRLFENQIGRSRAFCRFLFGEMQAGLGGENGGGAGVVDADALWRLVNAVAPGFIRTESDEVHYNLHILMRFDLERALIAGSLAVADLEAAWNERFLADFGQAVPDARRGVLQDVHWSAGLFGYFPTYTLGNIYAGEIHAALRRDIPDLDDRLTAGDLGAVLAWLGARIDRRGRMVPPRQLIAEAVGHEPDERALLDYLGSKYAGLHDL